MKSHCGEEHVVDVFIKLVTGRTHLPHADNCAAPDALSQTPADSRAQNHTERRHRFCPVSLRLPASSPEHQIHQLKPLPLEEALPIGRQHEAGAQGVEEVLHHLLLLGRGRVVTFEHL